jgi:hypothetical protein
MRDFNIHLLKQLYILLAMNLHFPHHKKHIELRYHFLCEKVKNQEITIK